MNCTCTVEDTFSNNICPACLEYYFDTFNTFDPSCFYTIQIKVKETTKTPIKITLYKSTKFKSIVDISFWNPFIAKALIKFPYLKFESVDNAHEVDSTVVAYPTLRLFFDDNSYVDYDVLRDGPRNANNIVKFVENGKNIKVQPTISKYFNYVQPYPTKPEGSTDGIYKYDFSLHPEEHQPSGSVNLSRIDNTQLKMYFPGLDESIDDEFFSHC